MIAVTAKRLGSDTNVLICTECGELGLSAADTADEKPSTIDATDHLQTVHGLTDGRVIYRREQP